MSMTCSLTCLGKLLTRSLTCLFTLLIHLHVIQRDPPLP